MLFVNELIFIDEPKKWLNEKFEKWRLALEYKRFFI